MTLDNRMVYENIPATLVSQTELEMLLAMIAAMSAEPVPASVG